MDAIILTEHVLGDKINMLFKIYIYPEKLCKYVLIFIFKFEYYMNQK